ncbi:MAG: DUF3300 domain-containing protein [Betaproteobacteria bacterium]|jgi:hypothetical protein
MRTDAKGTRAVAFATLIAFALGGSANAQAPANGPVPPASTAAAASAKTFSRQEIEQLLAPIALYPDELLAQVLMASTYPLDVVSAERWIKANPGLKGKAFQDALSSQPWDPSVKSLAVLPQVLTMMSEKLDWTHKLGDAFLAQPDDVMATAQSLRAKAVAQGTLKDSKEQKVVTEKVETTTIIKVEPANPEVVYVPVYNPTVVYGAWPYPAYPPYYYYPPGYAAGAAFVGFTAGVIVGSAMWGNCNWGHNEVNINVNRYNNFNQTNISNANWQHNVDRRGAVPYADKGVAQKYNRGPSANAQAREAYRGRGESGAQLRTDGLGSRAGGAGTAGTRPAGSQLASRDGYGTRSPSAFDTGSRAQAHDFSNRGASSLGSARASGGGRMAGGGGHGGMRGGGRR